MQKLWFLLLLFIVVTPIKLDEKREGRSLASAWTHIPSRSLAGLHYVFKGFEYHPENGLVKVTGPVIEITQGDQGGERIYAEGFTLEMDQEDFEEEQILAQSIFQARSGTGKRLGTAFLVGKDIVFTNRHIVEIPADSRNWECGEFSILLNHKEERVDCEKVRYCSRRYDYCVVQLKRMSNGLSVGVEVRPLRLAKGIKSDRDKSLLHIGNAGGLGLQASRGSGIKVKAGEFHHFVPTLNGSSGAPLFDEKGQVIGLNWGHTGNDYVGDSSYNRGILSETIYKELKRTHLWTLKEVRSFNSWYRREKKHREVRVVMSQIAE